MHIAEIWRYPVKSMAGERLSETGLGRDGIDGDRRMHVEDGGGRVVTARTHPRLLGHRALAGTDGTVTVDGRPWYDPAIAAAVAAIAGAGAQLVRRPTASSTSCRSSSPPTARSRPSARTDGGCVPTW